MRRCLGPKQLTQASQVNRKTVNPTEHRPLPRRKPSGPSSPGATGREVSSPEPDCCQRAAAANHVSKSLSGGVNSMENLSICDSRQLTRTSNPRSLYFRAS